MITRRFLLEMAGTSAAFLGASHLLPRGVSPAASESAFKHSPGKERGLFCDAFPRKMNRRCVEAAMADFG